MKAAKEPALENAPTSGSMGTSLTELYQQR